MNTLDEVIIGIREQMGFGDPILVDALHYLKEFQGLSKMWNDKLDKEQENQPLDWETLKQMEGKPVYVIYHTFKTKGWALVDYVDDNRIDFTIPSAMRLTVFEHQLGKTWNAYQKERG